MSQHHPNDAVNKSWLPYLIVVLGILFTLALSLLIKNALPRLLNLLAHSESLLPGLISIIGLSLSLLLAILFYFKQMTKQQANRLSLVVNDLKKEMTERILAEESKQKLEIALLQGQKLQSIGTLASGIAHDFNNILYAITGYTEMAREDIQKNTLVYVNLGKVIAAAHRGQALIARILSFSRIQHQRFEVIHLKSTLEAALALLKPTIPASVILKVNLDDIKILGNQTQIHQVLVNLINNAVDAMEGEGIISINSSHAIQGNACKLEIQDTGHGMDQTTLERIFEPFYTTKEVGQGTGLGLSIVHSIIKEHQGDITVTSQLGKGTTFTIVLPEYSEVGSNHG